MTGVDDAPVDRHAQDAALLARVGVRDETAFRLLHRRHLRACERRAQHVLSAPDLVDDVVQLVFLDVWRHAARFDAERGSVRTWLLQLTHHKAVDAVRAQERHLARHARQLLLTHEERPASPDEVVVAAQERDLLMTALAQLPRRQREALALCFFGELTQSQAAQQLGVPLGTVKSRTHTGVLRLRLLLGEDVRVPVALPLPDTRRAAR